MTLKLKYMSILIFALILSANIITPAITPAKLSEECRHEVEIINGMQLCKRVIAFDPSSSNTGITLLNYKNIQVCDAYLFFYDAEGRVRKFIYITDYPEYIINSTHYFDTEGCVVFSAFYERSAMDYALNGNRYMHKGKQVKLDIEMRNDYDEIVNKFEHYGEGLPGFDIYNRAFNMITHADSLAVFVNPGKGLSFPLEECRMVRFSPPRAGESTIVNVRKAAVHVAPGDSEVLFHAVLGDHVRIIDDAGKGWYQAEIDGRSGYIEAEYLEYVEHETSLQ